MSNITPRLPLYTSQPIPKIYATALLTHPWHNLKTSTPSTLTPKCMPPQHLVFINSCHSWKLPTAIYCIFILVCFMSYMYIFYSTDFNNQTRLPNIEINLKTPSIKVQPNFQSWTIISNQVLELNVNLRRLYYETGALFFNPLARF